MLEDNERPRQLGPAAGGVWYKEGETQYLFVELSVLIGLITIVIFFEKVEEYVEHRSLTAHQLHQQHHLDPAAAETGSDEHGICGSSGPAAAPEDASGRDGAGFEDVEHIPEDIDSPLDHDGPRKAKKAGGAPGSAIVRPKNEFQGKEFYYSKQLARMKVELTVLGFIAMLIWSARQLGVFDYESKHSTDPGWIHLFPDKGT